MDLDSVTRGLWDHPRGKFSIDRQAWRYRKIRATGSEHIQPKEALRNLAEVSEAFRSEGVDSWLINGTLLGVVRDGHLIPHDSDTDVGVMSHNPAAIRRSLLRCINKGFAIIRVTQRGDGISLMRKDEYMDISLYRRRRIFFSRYLVSAWGAADLYKYVQRLESVQVDGFQFKIPYRSEELLEFWYGTDWRTPISGKPRECNVPPQKLDSAFRSAPRAVVDFFYVRLRRQRLDGQTS